MPSAELGSVSVESVTLEPGHDVRRYHLSDAPRPPACLVLAPGAGAGQGHPFMRGVAEAIARHGVDVVTFDFPYRRAGRSLPDRLPVLEACFRDAVKAARSTALGGPHPRLYVGGKSMGGRVASHVATDSSADVSGVVALGYPLKPPRGSRTDRTTHLAQVRCPVLVVQGTRDAFGGPDEVAAAFATSSALVTVTPVEGADHAFAVRGETQAAVLARIAALVAAWVAREHPRQEGS
jgi:hypothetical protein